MILCWAAETQVSRLRADVRVCTAVVQKQQDLALLCPHLAVDTLQPLLEEKACHPSLPVCPVRDRKHAFIDAAKTPWVECLGDDEGSQLLISSPQQHGHAFKNLYPRSNFISIDQEYIIPQCCRNVKYF